MLGVKSCYGPVRKQYLDHFIFEETYKDIIANPEYWLWRSHGILENFVINGQEKKVIPKNFLKQ